MKIALLHNTESRYGVLRHFGAELAAALAEQAEVAVFDTADAEPAAFLRRWQAFDAQLLVTFNGLFAGAGGLLTADLLRVPTLYWLVDAPYHFDLVPSPWAAYACVDRHHCDYLSEQLPGCRCLFLPHGAAAARRHPVAAPRSHGCVMLSSAIDCRKLQEQWQRHYGGAVADKMAAVGAAFLGGGYQGLWQPFRELFGAVGDGEAALLQQIDSYVKGRGRLALLQAAAPHRVDLWGGGDDWRAILANDFPHVTYRGMLPYEEVGALLADSRVLLSSCRVFVDASHERILQGLAQGCAVFCEETPYLRQRFGDDSGLVYAPHSDRLGRLLQDEGARCQAVERGRAVIADGELWRHRASAIVAAFSRGKDT